MGVDILLEGRKESRHTVPEVLMLKDLLVVAMATFLCGCAAVWPTTHDTLYYHESQDGSRYYALTVDRTIQLPSSNEAVKVPYGFVWVTSDGTLYSSQGELGSSLGKDEDGQWDLHSYPIEQPTGYCIPLWSPHITLPESCWNRVWEIPSMLWLLAIPLMFL